MSEEKQCLFSEKLIPVEVSSKDNEARRTALVSFFDVLLSDFEKNYPEAKDLKECMLTSKGGFIIGKGIENGFEGSFLYFKGSSMSLSLSYYPECDLFVYGIKGRDYEMVYRSDNAESNTLSCGCELVASFQKSFSNKGEIVQ